MRTNPVVNPVSIDDDHIHVVAALIWHRDDRRRFLIAQRQKGKHLEDYWEFPGGKLEAGYRRGQLRWTWVEANTQAIGHVVTGGYTLEGLDTIDSNIDNFLISLDSRYWTGNNDLIAVFDTNNKLSTFTGSALPATLVCGTCTTERCFFQMMPTPAETLPFVTLLPADQ